MLRKLLLGFGLVLGGWLALRILRRLLCAGFFFLPFLLIPALVLLVLGLAGTIVLAALAIPVLILATPLWLARKLLAA